MAEVIVYGKRSEYAGGRMKDVGRQLGTVDTSEYLKNKGGSGDIGGLDSLRAGLNVASEVLGVSQNGVSKMSGLDVLGALREEVMNNESEQNPV